jgi:hypothetical protein
MIHYTCDCCKRVLDPDTELRYVVRLEVYAAIDPTADPAADDRDHLEEIQDMLDQLEGDADSQLGDDVYSSRRYDLCAECRNLFVKNPLGRHALTGLDFSRN